MVDNGMYSLVKYDNEEYDVVLSNMVKETENGNCTVKYKGTRYKAILISKNDNKLELIEYKNLLETMPMVNNVCSSPANNACSTVLTPIVPSASLVCKMNFETNLIASSDNNKHSISNSPLHLSCNQTLQSKLTLEHTSFASNYISLSTITTSDTFPKNLLQRPLSTTVNITSSSLSSTSNVSGFKQLLSTTSTTPLEHASSTNNYNFFSNITTSDTSKKLLQPPLSTNANITSSSVASTSYVSGFKELLPSTYTGLSSRISTVELICPPNFTATKSSSTLSTPNVSALKVLPSTSSMSKFRHISSSERLSCYKYKSSSTSTTPVVSPTKMTQLEDKCPTNNTAMTSSLVSTHNVLSYTNEFQAELLEHSVICSSCSNSVNTTSSSPVLTPNISFKNLLSPLPIPHASDASDASTNLLLVPTTSKVSAQNLFSFTKKVQSELSLERTFFQNFCSPSCSTIPNILSLQPVSASLNLSSIVSADKYFNSSSAATPETSPKIIIAVERRTSVNKAVENCPSAVSTPIVSDSKCSPEVTYSDNISSSSPSHMATPDINIIVENLSSSASTNVSNLKCSPERSYSDNISSSSSSPTATPDASPKKFTSVKLIPAVNNVGENLSSSASTTNVSNFKCSPELSYSDNISSSSSSHMATPNVNNVGGNLSSAVSTPIVSDFKCSPERTFSDNISSSSPFPTATPDTSPKKITSVKPITAVNNVGENLSSSASTTNVSNSKCSPERSYSDNISSSSSSPTATPDASSKKCTSVKLIPAVNNVGENLSSSASTTNVSNSKCSPERSYSDNISSSSSSPTATPDASSKKCTSVKLIPAVNNVGENLSSSASTTNVSNSKCSPELSYSDNISSSSSSHMATPNVNNVGGNLSSAVSTPIVSDFKCSPERTFSDNISSSSPFHTATPDASPKKITSVKLITAVNNVGENLSSSASTTNVSNSKCSPERSYSDNISSSSSSPTATPDASPKKFTSVKLIPAVNNVGENLSSSASTTNVSNFKCSPERSYSDNISSSSSFTMATPDASPKKITSVKLITAVNNVGENLSSSASTTSVSDSKCSPEHKYSDNISSSSSSHMATPDVYNVGENLFSAVSTPIVSESKCLPECTYSDNISSSSPFPTATPDASPKRITSVKLITAVNNVGENLSSSASTTKVSNFKCSPERSYSDNISSSSSSPTATPDASPKKFTSVKLIPAVNNVGENLSSASTTNVSDSKCSPEHKSSDNISSSSSSHTATQDVGENLFSAVSTSIVSDSKCSSERTYSDSIYSSSPSATPDVSPRKISSVKLIRAFNNAGENLTYSDIPSLSLSPTATAESSLSSAVLTPNVHIYSDSISNSSSSPSTTPNTSLNNGGSNLSSSLSTPIVSKAKCSQKRTYSIISSSSSSPVATPETSSIKIISVEHISAASYASANFSSIVTTPNVTNISNSSSTLTPDVSPEKILLKHISHVTNVGSLSTKLLPSTTPLSAVIDPAHNSSSQETEINCSSSILISPFPKNSFNSTNHTKSTFNTISEYFPDLTEEFLGESSLEEQNRSAEELIKNPLKLSQIKVPYRNTKSKKHFCIFCKTLQTKLARHFFLKHKSEKQIKEVLNLPSRSKDRLKVIDELRKRGDFLHNTSEEHNSGILIVTRQQQQKRQNEADDYVCCKNCKGFYSKNTLRIHLQKCGKENNNARDNLISGRKITQYIHTAANFTLRAKIFPVLRNDDITKAIRYDELIIKYGNKLSEKYTLSHQHDMIRSQLRLLGRFIIEIKKLDESIKELKDIFKPGLFDICIQALRVVANWDDTLMWFRTPAVAQSMTSIIKKCGSKQRTEFIKSQSEGLKKDLEDFLLLWEEDIPVLINKKAFDDQCNQKRVKKVVLPSKDDIRKLYLFLKNKIFDSIAVLEKKYSDIYWHELVKSTLIFIQIFNRRRAGEIERLTISNYLNKEVITDNVEKDILDQMSEESVTFAKQFVRLTLRGKLGRTVSVLLSPLSTKAIELILKHRTKAGITNNEYIFSKTRSSKFSKQYYRACPLLKQFAQECGAEIPQTLRGTSLRKHIATYTSLLNIEEASVDQLANFMGHHKDIHKSVYRVPVPVTEITCVSKLLMSAIGEDDDKEDEDNGDIQHSAPNDDVESRKRRSTPKVTIESETCQSKVDIESKTVKKSTISITGKKRSAPQVDIESEPDQNSCRSTTRNRRNASKVDIESKTVKKSTLSITGKKRSAPQVDIESETDQNSNTSTNREDESELNFDATTSSNKKRRSTSPYGKTTRRRWSISERDAIYSIFGNLKELERLPSLMTCLEAINNNPALKTRTPQQLKTWIDNQRRHK